MKRQDSAGFSFIESAIVDWTANVPPDSKSAVRVVVVQSVCVSQPDGVATY